MRKLIMLSSGLLFVLASLAEAQTTGAPPAVPDGPGVEPPALVIAQGPPAGMPGGGPPPPPPPHAVSLGGTWWRNSEIARRLALSDGQVANIEKTFLDHKLPIVDLRATLDKEQLKLQPLLDADRPDEAAVSAQLDRVIAARGKLEKANALMLLAIRRVLTPEQWHTLQASHREGGPGRPQPGIPASDRRPPPPPR